MKKTSALKSEAIANWQGSESGHPNGNGDVNVTRLRGIQKTVALVSCQAGKGFFNREDLDLTEDFLRSIRERGVLVPAVVRPVLGEPSIFEIIAGHRRHAAAVAAKLEEWPVIIIEATDQQLRELRLVENLQRADLSAIDEARQYQEALASGDYGTGKEAVTALAARVGKGLTQVYEKLQLLKASGPVLKEVAAGRLQWSTAALLAKVPDQKLQAEALEQVMGGRDDAEDDSPLTYRETQQMLRDDYQAALKTAPFDVARLYVGPIEKRKSDLKAMGACSSCPLRSEDGKLCMDPPCYKAKVIAHAGFLLDEGKRKGLRIVSGKDMFWRNNGGLKGDKYGAVDDRCDLLGYSQNKTWKQVLGEKMPAIVLAEDGEHRVHELFVMEEARAAFKAAGIKIPKDNSYGPSPAEKAKLAARQKKTKLLHATADVAAPQILDKLLVPGGGSVLLMKQVWALLAKAAYGATSIDCHTVLAKRRGWAKTQNEARNGIDKWLKTQADPKELARFTLECLLLSPGAHGNSWSEPAFNPDFKAAAELTGVKLVLPKVAPKAKKGGKSGKAKK